MLQSKDGLGVGLIGAVELVLHNRVSHLCCPFPSKEGNKAGSSRVGLDLALVTSSNISASTGVQNRLFTLAGEGNVL